MISEGTATSEDTSKKTVLCVFKDRRPVTFSQCSDQSVERKNLLDAVRVRFADVLSSGEGTSDAGSYFLQTESAEWGRIDLTGSAEDRSTIYLCYSAMELKAKNLCERLKQPTASSRAIASLFPACGSKRKFDPLQDCVVGEKQRQKKATNPTVRGRSKTITVVVLKDIPRFIPKGVQREELRKAGRVKDLPFHRVMSEEEVRRVILEGFKIKDFRFLKGNRENTLKVNEAQALDGNRAIQLAGFGSLYVEEQLPSHNVIEVEGCPGMSAVQKENTSTILVQDHSGTCTEDRFGTSTNLGPSSSAKVIEDSSTNDSSLTTKLSELITRLRNPVYASFVDDVACTSDEPSRSNIKRSPSVFTIPSTSSSEDEDWQWQLDKAKEKEVILSENRLLRAEQDLAFEESLRADMAKEEASKQLMELQENIRQLQTMVKTKFVVPLNDGIKIAFKLPDGTKAEFCFSVNATVKELYQFVLSRDVIPPFTLYATHPSLCLSLPTMCNEDIMPYKNTLLMVKENEGEYNVMDLADPVDSTPELSSDEMESYQAEDQKDRLDYMESINAAPGAYHSVERKNVYEDVLDLYQEGDIVGECPIFIEFKGELAIDEGGVQRDMFSAFWEQAYKKLFEGATVLTPMVHPQMDMSVFPIIGRVLSHGYLVAGILPTRIALPTLLCMLLGAATTVATNTLLDTFLDFISASDRQTFKVALSFTKEKVFPPHLQEELMNTLSMFGCRRLPTPSNLMNVIEQVARYEFIVKPAASVSLINSGIPLNHRQYWSGKTPTDIHNVYQRLSLSAGKVQSLLSFPEVYNQLEAHTAGYLRTMVGNMTQDELRNFMRFVSGSCVCVTPQISITFNSLSGFARRPIAHTCDCSLELPTTYSNYDDFRGEFQSILTDTENEFSWCMDAL